MKNLPINQRDSWSLLPNGKPKNEPQPNVFSAETFPKKENENPIYKYENDKEETVDTPETPEDPKAILDGYYTLIIFVTSGIIIGAILATITMFAIYATAIERGNLVSDTDDLIRQVQYNTEQIRDKVQQNADILPKINENIDKLGSGIVQELKPKEAKIVNN